jgi:hypothetical protein
VLIEAGESCVVLNRGASLRGDALAAGRAVLLTGNPRGGTTFVASVAHHLGIPLGKSQPRYEDRKLRQLLIGDEPNHAKLAETIREREANSALWGWKLPGIVQHFDLVDSMVQRPIYVIVFKDPLSIAMRKFNRGDQRLVGGLQSALLYAQRMVNFIATTERECVLVSFEKAVRKQGDFIRTLASLTGIEVDDARVAEIEAAVRHDSFLYDRKPDLAAAAAPPTENDAKARRKRRKEQAEEAAA